MVARGEGIPLDYKLLDYDWSRPGSNAELAKDLMAFANCLRPNSEPAYMLVGVDNQGALVGVPAAGLLDDAQLHQKAQHALNRTPDFSFTSILVGSVTIGVYEIRGGGRPYFPLRDAGTVLRRHVALYRNGSSTDSASPTMILEWAREDDPDAHRLRSLELRRLEAESVVHGRLRSSSVSPSGDALHVNLELENRGRAAFWVESCQWQMEWNENFQKVLAARGITVPPGYQAPRGVIEIERDLIQSGITLRFVFRLPTKDALKHFQDTGIALTGFGADWANYHFSVPCRGEMGGGDVLLTFVVKNG